MTEKKYRNTMEAGYSYHLMLQLLWLANYPVTIDASTVFTCLSHLLIINFTGSYRGRIEACWLSDQDYFQT